MPGEFENGGFTLKTHQMFSVHNMRGKITAQLSPVILELFLRKTQSGKSRDYRDVIVFEKLRSENVFCSREDEKSAFSDSSGLKSVVEKLRFHDRLVWTVDLIVEIKLPFGFLQTGGTYSYYCYYLFNCISFILVVRLIHKPLAQILRATMTLLN